MDETEELLFGGGLLLVGVCATIGVAVLTYILLRHTHKTNPHLLVTTIGYPLSGGVLVITVFYAFDTYMPELLEISNQYLDTIIAILAIWAIYRGTMFIVDIFYPKVKHGDNRVGPIMKFIFRLTILVFGAMAVLAILEVNITPLLAGAGIAGIAVALAAQDMLGNFFGGIVLYADKPFKAGDWIKAGDEFGEVLLIGPRSTRIKTLNAELMTIPNSKLSGESVINFSRPDDYMIIRQKINVDHSCDVDVVKETFLDAVKNVMANTTYLTDDEPAEANLLGFGDSSLKFELVICATSPMYYYKAKDAVNSEIVRLGRERGIELPYMADIRVTKGAEKKADSS